MPDTPAELTHERLLESVVAARSEHERDALLDEVRKRLEAAPEPRAPHAPWHPGNGGC